MDIGRMKTDVMLAARFGSLKSEPVKKPIALPMKDIYMIVIAELREIYRRRYIS